MIEFELEEGIVAARCQRGCISGSGFVQIVARQVEIALELLSLDLQAGGRHLPQRFFRFGLLTGGELYARQAQPSDVLDLVGASIGDDPFQALARSVGVAAVQRQLGQLQPDQGCIGRVGRLGQQRFAVLAGLSGIRFFHRHDEGVVDQRGFFRLAIAVSAPILPTENRDYAQPDAGEDADTVFLPPLLEIVDAFVVGILFHQFELSGIRFSESGDRAQHGRAQPGSGLVLR